MECGVVSAHLQGHHQQPQGSGSELVVSGASVEFAAWIWAFSGHAQILRVRMFVVISVKRLSTRIAREYLVDANPEFATFRLRLPERLKPERSA
jgi:hypothetical protein